MSTVSVSEIRRSFVYLPDFRFEGFSGALGSANSQPNKIAAAKAPASSATMNPGASPGAMPANVSLNDRAMVTAGLAKEVEAVNQ